MSRLRCSSKISGHARGRVPGQSHAAFYAETFSRGRGRGGSAERSGRCPLGHSGDSKRLFGAPARRLDQLRRSSPMSNIATVASAIGCLGFLYCLLSTL